MSLVELRKALKEEKLVFGKDEVVKKLKKGEAKKVFISKGFRDSEIVKKYASGVEVVEMTENAIELGTVCKKHFPVSVLCY